MRVPILGNAKANGGKVITGSRLQTGKITPTDTQIYPEGMTAIKFDLEGKEYVGVACEGNRFNYDRVLRLLRLLELYHVEPSKEPEKAG